MCGHLTKHYEDDNCSASKNYFSIPLPQELTHCPIRFKDFNNSNSNRFLLAPNHLDLLPIIEGAAPIKSTQANNHIETTLDKEFELYEQKYLHKRKSTFEFSILLCMTAEARRLDPKTKKYKK